MARATLTIVTWAVLYGPWIFVIISNYRGVLK